MRPTTDQRHRIARTGRFSPSFVMLALALALVCSLSAWHADDALAAPSELSGTAYIHCTNPGTTNDDGNVFSVTMPDGQTVTGYCQDYGIAFPADGSYSFSAVWNGESYDVLVHTSGAKPNPVCVLSGPCQRVGGFTWSPHGSIALKKASSNPSMTDGNPCYSLAGAVYGVYADQGCTRQVATMTTGDDGSASADGLSVGAYWVKEVSPSHSYALDGQSYQVDVTAGGTAQVNGGTVQEAPQNDPIGLIVGKIDAETTKDMPQGSASLAGAEYTVRYFASDPQPADGSQATRTWTIRTDADGCAFLDDGHKVAGDDYYRDSAGNPTVPIGWVAIQETKAPEGYLLGDQPVHWEHITSVGTAETVTTFNAPKDPEEVMRGGLVFQKLDAETGEPWEIASGQADLAAEFEVVNRSDHPMVVDGTEHAPGEVCWSGKAAKTDSGWRVETAKDAFPYGSYEVRESKPGKGYEKSSQTFRFTIDHDGQVADLGSQTFENQVVRADVKWQKKDEATSRHMARVPFLLRSETTGEAHVVVTDDNGQLDTSVRPRVNVNGNDAALSGDEQSGWSVDESRLDPDAGVYFGLSSHDGHAYTPDDSLGSLPYDEYDLVELPCAANQGAQLVRDTLAVGYGQDRRTVDLGTVDDKRASLQTDAHDKAGGAVDKDVTAQPGASVVDRVSYSGLVPGQSYTMAATLVDASTGEAVKAEGGEPATASKRFTAEAVDGRVELEVPFDAMALADGTKVVVCEELADASGRLASSHKDLSDADQTVVVRKPALHTTATDASDGDKDVSLTAHPKVADQVAYSGLSKGTQYKVTGALVDKQTGQAVATSSADLTPDSASGTVGVTFDLDPSQAASGHDLVAFESLTTGGAEVAKHADLTDEGQTVHVSRPELATTATDSADGDKQLVADGEDAVDDAVSYEGLAPDEDVELVGVLMDEDTGLPLVTGEGWDQVSTEELKAYWTAVLAALGTTPDGLSQGAQGQAADLAALDAAASAHPAAAKAVSTATAKLTPAQAQGTEHVSLTFDGSRFVKAGQAHGLVAYEFLVQDGRLIASHADLTDKGQSVEVVPPATPPEEPAPTGKPYAKTGGHVEQGHSPLTALAFGSLSVLSGAAALKTRRDAVVQQQVRERLFG